MRCDWQLKEKIGCADLTRLLPAEFTLEQQSREQHPLTLLDDYDWSVWHAGLLLYRGSDGEWTLSGAEDQLLAKQRVSKKARFWWDLPAGDLAGQLKKIVPLRAFVSRFSCHRDTRRFAVLNEDGKTVTRLQLVTLGQPGGEDVVLLTLFALRGYEQDAKLIRAAFQPVTRTDTPPLTLREQLLQAGLEVTKPATKPVFGLAADEPAETAVAAMVLALLDGARSQEEGILGDVDSEFVHQYRVNIRKARSLVSLFKKVFTPERYGYLNRELKALGKRTNTLRDLDVFLLAYSGYRDMLPDHLHPGLKQMMARLRRRRRTALRRVCQELQDETYGRDVEALRDDLSQGPDFATDRSRQPIRNLVAKKVRSQYAAIVRDGARIDDRTPDDAVHELRIECKKLRYLLELFMELFSPANMKQLITPLKLLQDNLGRFNDYAVQSDFLGSLAAHRPISSGQLATIHGLQAVLYDRQRQERGLVVDNIGRFSAADIQTVFRETFKGAVQGTGTE